MLFSKKITDQLTSDLSSLLLTFKIRGNKDSVVLLQWHFYPLVTDQTALNNKPSLGKSRPATSDMI